MLNELLTKLTEEDFGFEDIQDTEEVADPEKDVFHLASIEMASDFKKARNTCFKISIDDIHRGKGEVASNRDEWIKEVNAMHGSQYILQALETENWYAGIGDWSVFGISKDEDRAKEAATNIYLDLSRTYFEDDDTWNEI